MALLLTLIGILNPLPPLAYLGAWIAALTGIVFVPTHFLLKKLCPPAL